MSNVIELPTTDFQSNNKLTDYINGLLPAKRFKSVEQPKVTDEELYNDIVEKGYLGSTYATTSIKVLKVHCRIAELFLKLIDLGDGMKFDFFGSYAPDESWGRSPFLVLQLTPREAEGPKLTFSFKTFCFERHPSQHPERSKVELAPAETVPENLVPIVKAFCVLANLADIHRASDTHAEFILRLVDATDPAFCVGIIGLTTDPGLVVETPSGNIEFSDNIFLANRIDSATESYNQSGLVGFFEQYLFGEEKPQEVQNGLSKIVKFPGSDQV